MKNPKNVRTSLPDLVQNIAQLHPNNSECEWMIGLIFMCDYQSLRGIKQLPGTVPIRAQKALVRRHSQGCGLWEEWVVNEAHDSEV